MSRVPGRRAELAGLEGYHSPQVPASVRINTNESPYEPPKAWRQELLDELAGVELHRYPDRRATRLCRALADFHGVGPDEIFCANGSNEVLQCLLTAFGGPGRWALTFEPTYSLHAHIAQLTGTAVARAGRRADFTVDPEEAERRLAVDGPQLTFLCSPNNPTGTVESPEVVRRVVAAAPGLVVVDEAYGQFASWSALDLRGQPGTAGVVVVRTFSKTWALAGVRLGYLVADPEVVAACWDAALPYHLSTLTQVAGVLALAHGTDMAARVAAVTSERTRLAAALGDLDGVEPVPSEANFILLRCTTRPAGAVWDDLVARSVLVRDVSGRPGLEECLRVTVGTPEENDRFLDALAGSLR